MIYVKCSTTIGVKGFHIQLIEDSFDSAEGVKVLFHFDYVNELWSERRAVEEVKKLLEENPVEWISIESDTILFRLDNLRESSDTLSSLAWLQGVISVKPSIRIKPKTYRDGTLYPVKVIFTITPDILKRTNRGRHELRWGRDMKWDVFISYASEDRDAVVKPLVERLRDKDIRVWWDHFELKLGDHIRRKIDEGLLRSQYGVVVLSRSFFGKHFPNRELDGLAQREVEGKKVILPIWYKISEVDVRKYSPSLADLVAAKWGEGVDSVVKSIIDVLRPINMEKTTNHSLDGMKAPSDGRRQHESAEHEADSKLERGKLPTAEMPEKGKRSVQGTLILSGDGSDKCTECGKGTLHWAQWAPGPFGACTGWYRCSHCGAEFPGEPFDC